MAVPTAFDSRAAQATPGAVPTCLRVCYVAGRPAVGRQRLADIWRALLLCKLAAGAGAACVTHAKAGWAASPPLLGAGRVRLDRADVAALASFRPLPVHYALRTTTRAAEACCTSNIRACSRIIAVAASTQGRLNHVAEATRVAAVPLATLRHALRQSHACLAVVACKAASAQERLVAEPACIAAVPLATLSRALWPAETCLAVTVSAASTQGCLAAEATCVAAVPLATLRCALWPTDACLAVAVDAASTQIRLIAEAARVALVPLAPLCCAL